MAEVKVIYGSTTGNTEAAANAIAAAFAVRAINIADATKEDFTADLLLLGSSTWGIGELQDEWMSGISLLENADLAGRKVGVFGTGDQEGVADSYCDAVGIIAKTAAARGAEIIGKTSSAGYAHCCSAAAEGDLFCGLALDDNNQPELTPDRIAAWVEQIKKEAGI